MYGNFNGIFKLLVAQIQIPEPYQYGTYRATSAVTVLSRILWENQCCESGMFIPDPGAEFFPFRIPDPGSKRFPDPHPHQRIKVFLPNKLFLSSRKYDLKFSSRIRFPDPGVLKAPDPGSGSATLRKILIKCDIMFSSKFFNREY